MTYGLEQSELTAVLLSLKVAISAALIVIIPATALGWLLARKTFFGKLILESFVHAPMVMPPVVTGYLLLILFGSNGLIGRALNEWFGIQLIFKWQGAVLASVIVSMPLAVRSIRIAISMVDQKLEEAALTLGYTPFQVFVKITMPLAWPGVLSGILLAFTRSLGEFGATITFAGNIEGLTQTIPLALYSSMQSPGNERASIRLVLFSLLLCFLSLILSEILRTHSQRRLNNATLC